MAKYNIEYEIEEGEYISLTHEKMERLLDTIKSFIDVPSLSRFVKPFNPYFTSSYYAKLFRTGIIKKIYPVKVLIFFE